MMSNNNYAHLDSEKVSMTGSATCQEPLLTKHYVQQPMVASCVYAI